MAKESKAVLSIGAVCGAITTDCNDAVWLTPARGENAEGDGMHKNVF